MLAVVAACAGLNSSAGAGCFARTTNALVCLQLSGTAGLEPQPTLAGSGIDGWLIRTVFLASVVLASLIEEVLFRGFLPRSLARSMRRVRSRAAPSSPLSRRL